MRAVSRVGVRFASPNGSLKSPFRAFLFRKPFPASFIVASPAGVRSCAPLRMAGFGFPPLRPLRSLLLAFAKLSVSVQGALRFSPCAPLRALLARFGSLASVSLFRLLLSLGLLSLRRSFAIQYRKSSTPRGSPLPKPSRLLRPLRGAYRKSLSAFAPFARLAPLSFINRKLRLRVSALL